MFENYDSSIPSVEAYLQRIGAEAPRKGLTLEYLDELIRRHQCSVPFENLDIYDYHRPISLEIPDLFDKIVTRRRGGYCFELNGLFLQLLRDLGYNAWPCVCRGLLRPGVASPILHRAVLVRLDHKVYLCDVGFGGPSSSCALPLEEGTPRTCLGKTFYLRKAADTWWTVVQQHTEEEDQEVLCFSTSVMEPVDFIPLSYYCSTAADSYFLTQRMASLRTPEGSISISGMTFKETSGKTIQETLLDSPALLEDVLRTRFGMLLS